MHATAKALTSQLCGAVLVIALGTTGAMPPLEPLPLACLQGIFAAIASRALRSERWWVPIHLAFLPLTALAFEAQLPTWLYGLGFLALASIYWTTFRTQVPLFLSNKVTIHRLASWLTDRGALRILDVGSGSGTFVIRLARLRPDWRIDGIETAPLPLLWSRRCARSLPNVKLVQGDFWQHELNSYDVVYAFLSPVPMRDLWRKARKEMRAGTLLISNSFAIPELSPESILRVGDRRDTQLYCYRIPGNLSEKEKLLVNRRAFRGTVLARPGA